MKEENMILISLLAMLVVCIVFIVAFKITDGNLQNLTIASFDDCVAAGNPVMESYPRKCSANGITFTEKIQFNATEYFSGKMVTEGVEKLGAHPIEGFTPGLYILALPKLKLSDFDNVEAYGGKWVLSNNDLKFQRDNLQPITSADGTVTSTGMKLLLDHLSTRLNLPAVTQEDVDRIIKQLE